MIFSGKESKKLWKAINRLGKRKKLNKAVEKTLYLLGCKCQELEAEMKRKRKKLHKALEETLYLLGRKCQENE